MTVDPATLVQAPEGGTGISEPERRTRALIVMPLATPNGGSEIKLMRLLEQRSAADLEPTVAFLEPGPMATWCEHQEIPHVVIAAGRLREAGRGARTVRALAKLARERDVDVILSWMTKGQVYGGLAAAYAQLPAVWVQCGFEGGALDRAASTLPAKVVITNSYYTDEAQRNFRPRRRTAVIHPPVDTARFNASRIGPPELVRTRLGLPERGLIVGSVGRLQSWKGMHVLLEAAPRLLERHPDLTVVLVGGPHHLEPDYPDRLAALAARFEEGHVRLVGFQPNPEEWMQAMDVFVHTSHNEPFGMVIAEAMALGKPVVASLGGGPSEIITAGRDGLLVPYGDVEALRSAVLSLTTDARLRAELGDAAKRRADDFNSPRYAEKVGSVVAEAARSRRPSTKP